MTKVAQDLRPGDFIRPCRHPETNEICDPAFKMNFSHLDEEPKFSKHVFGSFDLPHEEIFFVLANVPPVWDYNGGTNVDIDKKFLALTSRGVCVIWVYADEAFEIIGG